jgi:hypothetical protein
MASLFAPPSTVQIRLATGDAIAGTPAQTRGLLGLSENLTSLTLPASTTISAFGATLIDDAAAVNARATLGLVIGTDVQAWSAILDATTASFTAADESKLDGIEALADVTDTANVTAAGALMDSEVTSLAAIKDVILTSGLTISANWETADETKLAGIEAGADVTDWTNVAAVLAAPTSPFVFNESGADQDFRVEGVGNTHLFMLDAGSNLVGFSNASLAPTDGLVHIQSGSAGVVTADSNANELVIESAVNGGLSILAPTTCNIYLGDLSSTVGRIVYTHTGNTMALWTNNTEVLKLSINGFIWNEDGGAAADFRVEGDTSTHLLFCDAGNNRVGVSLSGNLVTDGLLHVASGSAGTVSADTNADELVLEGPGNMGLSLVGTDIASQYLYFKAPTNSDTYILYNQSASLMTFHVNGFDRMDFSSAGVIFNETGGAGQDFRVESDLNTHMLYVDAGNNSVHIDNSLLTGAGDGDLVMANAKFIRWNNTAGTSNAKTGIRLASGDNIEYHVPATTDLHRFVFDNSVKLDITQENSGTGILFRDESSADHAAPAANNGVIYTKDDGAGNTELYWRNSTGVSKVTNAAAGFSWTQSGAITLATGSPTSVTLLSGVSDVNEIEIWITGASTNTANTAAIIQIGDSGGIETTGYDCDTVSVSATGTSNQTFTDGFSPTPDSNMDAADACFYFCTLRHLGSNLWAFRGDMQSGTVRLQNGVGDKTLSGTLTQMVLTTRGGTATFDGGTAYVRYR